MILHWQGTQPRLIDSSINPRVNLNLRKRISEIICRARSTLRALFRMAVPPVLSSTCWNDDCGHQLECDHCDDRDDAASITSTAAAVSEAEARSF
jgi:hypothetical protein